jgi:hypothetical protein
MSIQITYDNFTFNNPIPFVSKNQEIINYGDRWGQITKISLQGQLTGLGGCPDNFMSLISGQNNLISGFSRDFKKLSIIEDGNTLFQADSCIVRSINFDQSRYVKLLNYSIDLDCYERDLFSGVYGVLDPVNEYTFTENEDQSITINHNISARGINTSNNSALNNAKNYVYTLTGYNPNILPININNANYTPLIRSYVENLNRLNGTYSIQENYIVDISNNAYTNPSYFTRYTTNISKNLTSDFNTISIQGTIQGAKTGLFANTRTYAQNLDLYTICQDVFDETLNDIPISLSFEENQAANLINFSATFDTDTIDPVNDPYFDYSVEISKDTITSFSSITISGPIKSRGNLKERFENAQQFITNQIGIYGSLPDYLFNEAQSIYNNLKTTMNISSSINLNNRVRNFSITESPERGEIVLSATFDDRDVPASSIVKTSSFNVTIEPKIDLFRPRPTYDINGFYIVYDLGNAKKLGKANVSATTEFAADTPTNSAKTTQDQIVGQLKSLYANGTYYTKNISSSVQYSRRSSISDPSAVFLPGKVSL